jgi:hypothetical protein
MCTLRVDRIHPGFSEIEAKVLYLGCVDIWEKTRNVFRLKKNRLRPQTFAVGNTVSQALTTTKLTQGAPAPATHTPYYTCIGTCSIELDPRSGHGAVTTVLGAICKCHDPTRMICLKPKLVHFNPHKGRPGSKYVQHHERSLSVQHRNII